MASLLPSNQQKKQPVIVSLEGRTLIIDCLFYFNRRALQEKPDPDRNETYAEIISDGIAEKWHGTYPASAVPASIRPVDWQVPANVDGTSEDTVQLDVRIRQLDPRQRIDELLTCYRDSWRQGFMAWLTRRRAVKISVRPMLIMPAHVISPLYRRIWGFLRTGQLESLGLNWSPRHPGRIVMPPYKQVWMIKAVAAHEAGHVFGLGDAYGAIYRFYHEAPSTLGYMMNNNQQVHAEEVRMLLQAHLDKRMQFFPRKWNTRRFFSGLVCEFRQRSRQMQANWSGSKHSWLSVRRESRLSDRGEHCLSANPQKKDQRRNERR